MSADLKVNFKKKKKKKLPKMRDFNIMTQNSILINFDMNFIIEIVTLGLFKNLEFINTGYGSSIGVPSTTLI